MICVEWFRFDVRMKSHLSTCFQERISWMSVCWMLMALIPCRCNLGCWQETLEPTKGLITACGPERAPHPDLGAGLLPPISGKSSRWALLAPIDFLPLFMICS